MKPSCCRKIKRNIFNKKYHRYMNCLSSRTWPNYRVFETKNVNNNYLKKVHHSLRCGSGDSFALVEEMHFISCYQCAGLKFRWNKNGVSVVKTASNKHIQYLKGKEPYLQGKELMMKHHTLWVCIVFFLFICSYNAHKIIGWHCW